MPTVPVHFCKMDADGACMEPSPRYPNGRILLKSDTYAYQWRGVLLHEMIHLLLDRAGVDEYEHGPVAWHGPKFAAECNRIGALLGLPHYDVDDVWAWPDAHLFVNYEPTVDE